MIGEYVDRNNRIGVQRLREVDNFAENGRKLIDKHQVESSDKSSNQVRLHSFGDVYSNIFGIFSNIFQHFVEQNVDGVKVDDAFGDFVRKKKVDWEVSVLAQSKNVAIQRQKFGQKFSNKLQPETSKMVF